MSKVDDEELVPPLAGIVALGHVTAAALGWWVADLAMMWWPLAVLFIPAMAILVHLEKMAMQHYRSTYLALLRTMAQREELRRALDQAPHRRQHPDEP